MTDFSIWSVVKGVVSSIGKLSPFARRLWAERRASRDPCSVTLNPGEPLLDGALKRLGFVSADDPIWKAASFGAAGLVVRAEEFRKPHVKEWLTREDTKAG